jgi:hypothetical protein
MDPKFNSQDKPPVNDVSRQRCLPLEQVATYCRYGQTRYGFILTQTELVALRVRRIQPLALQGHFAAVEYASVPWDAKRKLTVNLAIWALGCMGMNAGHREMETSDGKNMPLDRMARLTWWKYESKEKVYENVISKRRIPASAWKKDYEKFVHLTEQAGNSFTRDFEHSSGSASGSSQTPPPQPGLSSPAPAASAQPPTTRAKAAAAKAMANATTPAGPKPLAPVAAVHKPPVSAAKASVGSASNPTAPAPKGVNPTPPVAAAAAPRPSRSTTTSTPRERKCVINKTKYMATYSSENKKWKVKVKGKEYLIEYTSKPVVKIGGETWDVCWE